VVKSLLVEHDDSGTRRSVVDRKPDELGEGDVLVEVHYSSVNFKDALAAKADGKVARIKPIVPGIDMAGTVVEGAGSFSAGESVLAHGYDLGVAHHGGFSEQARVPAEWVVPLPAGLTEREAMIIGTAGFTAGLSIDQLERNGLRPDAGPVLVTGATGGVGSMAVAMLAGLGYEVAASTGSAEAGKWLTELGAARIVDRAETSDASRPLQREQWAGAVDCVGGDTLAYVISSLRYGAAVAASGNVGGVKIPTTVFPFILRGVSLLGIDSAQCPIERRRAVWARLGGDLKPAGLDSLVAEEVSLDGVPAALDAISAGSVRGRTLVKLIEG
jgi:acrylyl-CoA reductase (NADPH)